MGSGFFETESWTGGVGSATASDQFFSGVASPFGGSFFSPCDLWGGGGGLVQSGLGGNVGAQNSATGTYSRSTAFGMAPLGSLVFGIPVAGPAGLLYC